MGVKRRERFERDLGDEIDRSWWFIGRFLWELLKFILDR